MRKIPSLSVSLKIILFQSSTSLFLQSFIQPSRSWVKQFFQMLNVHLSQTSISDCKDITGLNRNYIKNSAAYEMWIKLDAAISDRGIVFGTSSQAVDKDDYSLISIISQGIGAGQLEYASTLYSNSALADGYRIKLQRSAINNSPGAITAREVGLYVEGQTFDFMILRDVITPVTIEVSQGITAIYYLDFIA